MSQAHNLKGEKELFKLEFEIQKGKMLEFIIPFECYPLLLYRWDNKDKKEFIYQ